MTWIRSRLGQVTCVVQGPCTTHPSSMIEAFVDVAVDAVPSKPSIKAGIKTPNSVSSFAVPASCELHNLGNISTSTQSIVVWLRSLPLMSIDCHQPLPSTFWFWLWIAILTIVALTLLFVYISSSIQFINDLINRLS